jgi:hypothetical protein
MGNHRGSADYLKRGDWNAICDVCGFKFKASELKKRWDNMMVCEKDFEFRHPQDFLKSRRDNQAVSWSRPGEYRGGNSGAVEIGGVDINGNTFPPAPVVPSPSPITVSLTNPGFETGNTTGWTPDPAVDMAATGNFGGTTPQAGSYFLIAKNDQSSVSSFYQRVDLLNAGLLADDIDSTLGRWTVNLSTWQKAVTDDIGYPIVKALDENYNYLDQRTGADIAPTSWQQISLQLDLPINTRHLEIRCNGRRTSGTAVWVAWDTFSDLSFAFTAWPTDTSGTLSHSLENPGAESGTTQGWTGLAASSLAAVQNIRTTTYSRSGNWALQSSDNSVSQLFYQRIDLVAAGLSSEYIDLGTIDATASTYLKCSTTNHTGRFSLVARDIGGNTLDSTALSIVSPQTYTLQSITHTLPVGTRYLDVQCEGWQTASTEIFAYWDDFSDVVFSNIPVTGGTTAASSNAGNIYSKCS